MSLQQFLHVTDYAQSALGLDMRPSPRRPHYALQPVRLSVPRVSVRLCRANRQLEIVTNIVQVQTLMRGYNYVRSNWQTNFEVKGQDHSGWKCENVFGGNKKLSCLRETARRLVSLNILLSHSRSFQMTLLSRACVSRYYRPSIAKLCMSYF